MVEEMVVMRRKPARWPRRLYEVILFVCFRGQVKKMSVCVHGRRKVRDGFGWFLIAWIVLTGYSCIWLYFVGLGSTWRSLAFYFRFTASHV